MRNLSNNAFDKPCVKLSSLEFCHDEKEWQENVPVRACSLSGNSNKVRYPEEIPKTYRRKGNKTEEDRRGQKRTKEGRRHEGKTAGGRKLSSPKARYYQYKTGEQTRLRD